MANFNVGDRVRVNESGYEVVRGREGIVRNIERESSIAVEFDEEFSSGHNCDGYCERNKGYWLSTKMLELTEKKEVKPMNEREVKKKINELFTRICNTTDDIDGIKYNYEKTAKYIEDTKVKLTKYMREYADLGKKLAYYEVNVIDFYSKIQEVSRSSKIKQVDVDLDKCCITALTECLYFSTMNGARYLGGEYKIEYYPDNNQVKFFATTDDMKRKSYWSETDPHPHVNGTNGEACLGNTSDSLAYLAGEHEYQVIFEILVAFLEQANIDDCAGRHAMNWDKVDYNNVVIREGYQDKYYTDFSYDKDDHENDVLKDESKHCARCEEYCDDGEIVDGEFICRECLNDYYYRCNDCGDYAHADDTYYIESEDYTVCVDCRENNYTYCDECSKYHKDDDITSIDDNDYCEECRDKKFFECEQCGEWHDKDDMYINEDSEELCSSCYDSQQTEESDEDEL